MSTRETKFYVITNSYFDIHVKLNFIIIKQFDLYVLRLIIVKYGVSCLKFMAKI